MFSSIFTSDMTSSPVMREKYYQASGAQDQYYPGNPFFIPHSTSSYREPSYMITPTYVSPSLSESNYTDYLAANEYEIEDNSDVQSNSFYTSEARSRRGGSVMLYNESTITGGRHNNQTARNGHNLAVPGYDIAKAPIHFDARFTEFDTPYYSPYDDTTLEELQPTEFSSNCYSNIGSQFQPDETQNLERNPFMDPVFFEDSSIDVQYNHNSTAASQESSANYPLPFNLNLATDRRVPPAIWPAKDHQKRPYFGISTPIVHTDRAVMPTDATTWSAFAMTYFPAGSTAPSNTSPSVVSAETSHLDKPPTLSCSCYNASSRAAATHISPHREVASLCYNMNGTTPGLIPLAQASSNLISTSHRLGQGAHPSLSSKKTLKPSQPRAADFYGHDKLLDAIPFRNTSFNPPASLTKPKREQDVSKCPWPGCTTTTKGKHRTTSMQAHVRTKHKKLAPPICEICGIIYQKNDSLKRHLRKKNHEFVLPKVEGLRIVMKENADGTLYSTYQQVHDYVNGKRMGKLDSLLFCARKR